MFINPFGVVILVSFLACLVITTYIYIISKYEEWDSQNAVYIGFNAV